MNHAMIIIPITNMEMNHAMIIIPSFYYTRLDIKENYNNQIIAYD